ncbi:MAG: 6-phosphogluconolactonase [Phycisphaerae bacterium]
MIIERTADEATAIAADLFKCIACETVGQRDNCRVALAGGTTPHALYQLLAKGATTDAVPWRKVEVFFGDERDVPQDHVESNYRMAQRTLLDHVPIEPGKIHPMPADAEDLAAASADYERTIRERVPAGPDGIPRFDLVFLGMGGDGHTASLFPGTEMLSEKTKLVTSGFVPVLGRSRMTFTFPLINAAHNIIMLVTGTDKAQAVLGMLGESPEIRAQLPAAGVNPREGSLIVVLDAAAARLTGMSAG